MADKELSFDIDTRQLVTLNGFEYDVRQICGLLDSGFELKAAIRHLYKTLPEASIPTVVAKVKKHAYYIARADMQLNILKAKGPELQQNLLSIAFDGRSERNRLDATNSAMDRIYGNADKQEDAGKPQFVFNFSFGGGATPQPTVTVENDKGDTLEVIDV